MRKGFLYIATGERYIDAAERSARSLRRAMPGAHVTLASDQPAARVFDAGLTVPAEDGYRAKILAMQQSPYDRTVMLDVDTYVLADLSEMFILLNRFHMGLAHAPNRVTFRLKDIPDSYPEFNTGVIALRRSRVVRRVLHTWLAEYDRLAHLDPPSKDQPSFRRVAYHEHKLRLATLAPEFNLRFAMAGFLNQPVRVLHGWAGPDRYEAIGEVFNRHTNHWADRLVFADGKLINGRGEVLEQFELGQPG